MDRAVSDIKATLPEKTILPERWPGELRALLSLGVPMALTQLAQFSIYTIDAIMIGRVGPEELAAASLGTVIYFFLWMVGAGPVMAVTPMVSQALGADKNNRADARRSVRMALWAIFLMFPFVFGFILLTEPVAIWLGQDPQLSRRAGQYVLALSFGWPFALCVMALRNFLAALGKTTIPLILVMVTTLINAVLNYVLIFGAFGFPRLELIGAGIASSLAYIMSFFIFVLYIKRDPEAAQFNLFSRFFKSDWPRFKEIIILGWPISVTTIFEGMLFNAAVLLMGLIGIMEVAAYQVAINVVALAFMLPWGLSMAGAVRVGLAAGANNSQAVKRASLTTLISGTLTISFCAVAVTLAPQFIAGLYLDASNAKNDYVISLIVAFLPIAGMFMLFDAAQVCANQLLRGLKDVNWPMTLTGISYWVIGFPIAYYLGLKTSLGPLGIWYGLMAGLFSVSVLLGIRLWLLVWKTG